MKSHLTCLALLPLLLLACDGTPAESPEVSDAQAVAAVEAAQNREPPPQAIMLEPIPREDIDRYNLHDQGCNLTRPNDGGAPLILINDGRAMVRVQGEMVPLAADVGGAQLGTRAWQHYSGKRFALTLKAIGSASLPAEGEAQVRDAWGRVVFATRGRIACTYQ
jgi:hypothetical protein